MPRPLRLRMRCDLIVRQHEYQGRRYWVIKDPLAQSYYRFEDEEYRLLEMLDGEVTLEDLRRRFEEQFAPQKIELSEIHQLITMLHRSSLLIADQSGQGEELLGRHHRRLHRERWGAFTNLLCVRFKGVDPDRLLGWLDSYVGWLFSPLCYLFSMMLALAAVLLIAVQFESFRGRLPEFQEFFAGGNWLWLAATLAVTKVIHEFGHGLACKRYGGECHEMGVMLLVLTPCLYCNVSDSWMLPSKWHRAAIGAAGMYFELLIASVATFLWWFSEPGLLNYLCLNVMFICSVSTLLFNANPLLRYDGYYILSDLLEIPNLRQKATAILRRKLAWLTLGFKETPDPFLPQRHQTSFAAYAVAAAIYRWFVVFGILWFLYHVFEPYGLKVIGQLMVVISAYGLFVQPLVQAIRFLRVPGRYEQVNRIRFGITVGALVVLGAGLFGVSLPRFVQCDAYLQSRDTAMIYVESAGVLEQIHVQPGDWVAAGDRLVTLSNLDVDIAVERLIGQRQQLESKLASLRQRAFTDESAVGEIAEVAESLEGVRVQLDNRERERRRLEIVAPRAGYVIPAPSVARNANDHELPTWSGSPLDPQNLQGVLSAGDQVCRIGDPSQYEAILAIDQGDLEFVEAGQPVGIVLDALPDRRVATVLGRLASQDMEVSPASLSAKAGGTLATRTDGMGRERPLSTTYQGAADVDDQAGALFPGATGRAQIRVRPQTLAQRAWRFVCRTFSFDV